MKLASSAIRLLPAGNRRPVSRLLAPTGLGAQLMRGR